MPIATLPKPSLQASGRPRGLVTGSSGEEEAPILGQRLLRPHRGCCFKLRVQQVPAQVTVARGLAGLALSAMSGAFPACGTHAGTLGLETALQQHADSTSLPGPKRSPCGVSWKQLCPREGRRTHCWEQLDCHHSGEAVPGLPPGPTFSC